MFFYSTHIPSKKNSAGRHGDAETIKLLTLKNEDSSCPVEREGRKTRTPYFAVRRIASTSAFSRGDLSLWPQMTLAAGLSLPSNKINKMRLAKPCCEVGALEAPCLPVTSTARLFRAVNEKTLIMSFAAVFPAVIN